ncbi:MAG: alkene reductase [Kordiimonadaceae bacterium]|nr:alkene reductase [Kordiimonadaceae bacterium]
MSDLFDPITVGNYTLKNRVFMAPLTRSRADENGVPKKIVAEYYGQRASAGLIIAEATAISQQTMGWLNAPGIFTDEQQASWANIADAVHAEDGRIFVQIWHMGGAVHPDFVNGDQPVSSSSVKLTGAMSTPKGPDKDLVEPRPLSKPEIKAIVQDFVGAARRAVDAGLDGVEIHAANGFLLDQFIRDGVNQRDDEYGGTIENRMRFMVEVIEAVVAEIGSGKVGIRLSPTNKFWGISDTTPSETFGKVVEKLNEYNLAYVHLLEPLPGTNHFIETIGFLTPEIRAKYTGTLLVNGGYDKETGNAAIENGEADAVVYGANFIANPDLVARYKLDAELAAADQSRFYTEGAEGYSDYPALAVEYA